MMNSLYLCHDKDYNYRVIVSAIDANEAIEKLKKYNQEHLLMFYDELDDSQKQKLLNQILSIDFNEILTLYKNSYIEMQGSDGFYFE